jgi:signal transduction histidine kinase
MLQWIEGPKTSARATWCAWLLASLLASSGLAQTVPEVAELEKKIAAAPADAKLNLLLELADRLEPIDVDRALSVAQQAHDLARTPAERLAAEAEQASLRRGRGDYAEAMQLAETGLAAADKLDDDRLRARFHYVIARTEWSLGDFAVSTESFHHAIQLAEKVGDRPLLCDAHLGISTIYHDLNQPEQATLHLDQARQISEQLGDARRLGDYYKILGNQRAASGDRDGARAAHERSRQIHEQAGNERGVADALQNLAALAVTPAELNTSVADCTRAIAIYERLGLPRHRLNAEREFGRVLVQLGRANEAIPHLQTSLSLARSLGGRNAAANAERELANAYEAVGNLRAALDAQRQLKVETDALLGEKARQQIAVLNARYEADRREHEIALLRGEQARKQAELRAKDADLLRSSTELERANAMRFALGMSLLALAVALGAFVLHQRTRLHAERRVLAETQAAKEAAEEADRVKTRFLGVATHDIRAPLGNIVTLAGLLRKEPAAVARGESLDIISSEAQRVLSLVEELLTVAALETGKLELHRAPIDLTAVAQAAVDTLRWQAGAKRQELELHRDPSGSTRLVADAARLHQVVTNLVSNAIKFSPLGKTITVSLSHTDSHVTLAVRDEGPGVSAADTAKLFAPFERLSTHPTAGELSHGLGLSIAHEIVRLHGGKIRVESQPGAGATFFVELPAGAPAPQPVPVNVSA